MQSWRHYQFSLQAEHNRRERRREALREVATWALLIVMTVGAAIGLFGAVHGR